jgi:hypothetical protein
MKIVCHFQLLVFFNIWYVHAIGLKGKKDIKYLTMFKQQETSVYMYTCAPEGYAVPAILVSPGVWSKCAEKSCMSQTGFCYNKRIHGHHCHWYYLTVNQVMTATDSRNCIPLRSTCVHVHTRLSWFVLLFGALWSNVCLCVFWAWSNSVHRWFSSGSVMVYMESGYLGQVLFLLTTCKINVDRSRLQALLWISWIRMIYALPKS